MTAFRLIPATAVLALSTLSSGVALASSAEVKLDRDYIASVVEKLPACPFDKAGQYRGSVYGYQVIGLDPAARRFVVTCLVAGEFRPPTPVLKDRRKHGAPENGAQPPDDVRWKKFRFEVRARVNVEPSAQGLPRFRVEVEQVKRQELEGLAGTVAKFMGKYFDEIVTQVAAGKVTKLSDKLNAEVVKKTKAFKEYGIFSGIDYTPTHVVLHFDLTRFKSEGVAGYVFATQQPGTVPLYRWTHRRLGAHLYTTSLGEADPARYVGEGIACYVFAHPDPQCVPLYHWVSRTDHLYTTSQNGDGAGRVGYRPIGAVCYLYRDQAGGTVPLYRFVDPRNGRHFYTLHPHAEFAK